jgi:hypothetical protein
LFDFPFPFFADALASANARIASLEAELNASRKAFDVATATKENAEKSHKSALAKAKKAEKALADANKEHLQQEQAMAERLHTMSAAAGGTHSSCTLLLLLLLSCSCRYFLFLLFFYPLCCTEFTKVSLSTLQPGDDPLMAAVNLLEANWISVQEIFELVNRILMRMFVGFWPKQKAEVPNSNLKKLAEAFNTTDDLVLQLKGLSLKRGAEGAIALSYAHGADFDWEKIRSPHGHTRSELKAFFEKAKKFAPAIVSIISPSVASAASFTPTSSTPATADSTPPSTAGADFAMPSSATEQNAEVA